MKIYEFTRSIHEINGVKRISEYAYSGVMDSDGEIRLSRCVGHIYPVKATNIGIGEELTDMSIKSQQANMKAIYSLVSRNLGYIHGNSESGPNGAKKQFLTKSASFLRALGKDLGFTDMKVSTNPGGIAVSGEITLMGMWSEGNGLYLQIFQSVTRRQEFLYRHISGMKDYTGGANQWITCSSFVDGDYEKLMKTLLALRKPTGEIRHVA